MLDILFLQQSFNYWACINFFKSVVLYEILTWELILCPMNVLISDRILLFPGMLKDYVPPLAYSVINLWEIY